MFTLVLIWVEASNELLFGVFLFAEEFSVALLVQVFALIDCLFFGLLVLFCFYQNHWL